MKRFEEHDYLFDGFAIRYGFEAHQRFPGGSFSQVIKYRAIISLWRIGAGVFL